MRYNYNDSLIRKLQITKMEMIKEATNNYSLCKIRVQGESMLPCITDGELLSISPVCTKDELSIGDIIFFYDSHFILALHRLILINKSTYILKGDNTNTVDRINFEQIIGKVVTGNQNNKTVNIIRRIDKYSIQIKIIDGELIRCHINKC